MFNVNSISHLKVNYSVANRQLHSLVDCMAGSGCQLRSQLENIWILNVDFGAF